MSGCWKARGRDWWQQRWDNRLHNLVGGNHLRCHGLQREGSPGTLTLPNPKYHPFLPQTKTVEPKIEGKFQQSWPRAGEQPLEASWTPVAISFQSDLKWCQKWPVSVTLVSFATTSNGVKLTAPRDRNKRVSVIAVVYARHRWINNQ